MTTRPLATPEVGRSQIPAPDAGSTASVLRLGAVVSVIQSGLFVVIGVAGLVLGVDRLVEVDDRRRPRGVTFVTGPLWHLWIPRLFLQSVRERRHDR
jgi:hypothetical protein